MAAHLPLLGFRQCPSSHCPFLADVERIADPASSLPHMLPSDQQFAAAADALGISNDDALVVYDNTGGFGRCGEVCVGVRCSTAWAVAVGIWTVLVGCAAAQWSWIPQLCVPKLACLHLFSACCHPLQASSPAPVRGGRGMCLAIVGETGCDDSRVCGVASM